jgi:hypothetical protein
MGDRPKMSGGLVRVFALTLAVLFVLFVGLAVSHSHAKGQIEGACQICQAAHVGSAPAAGTTSLVSPLLETGYIQPLILTIHQEFFFHDSPSRAPPTK